MPSTANKIIEKKDHGKKENKDATGMHCWKGFEKKGVQELPSGKKANVCKAADETPKLFRGSEATTLHLTPPQKTVFRTAPDLESACARFD